jgi:hypothetical protein
MLTTYAALYVSHEPSLHRLSKNVKPKEKKARQATGPKAAVEESQPKYGEADSTHNKNNSEKRKRQITKQLAQDQHIPLADFVIDPKSFGTTVENIFACKHTLDSHASCFALVSVSGSMSVSMPVSVSVSVSVSVVVCVSSLSHRVCTHDEFEKNASHARHTILVPCTWHDHLPRCMHTTHTPRKI